MELFALGIFGALVITPWDVALWILGPVVSIVLVCVIVAAARRGNPADPAADTLVFRYPPRWRWWSVCFALAPLGVITGMVVAHPPQDWEDVIYIALSYAMFGGLSGVLLWDVFRFRLEVGPDGFDCRSPWRPHSFIRWTEVVDVSFNSPLGWFEVRATDGRAVRLPALVGALETFLERCEQRLTPSQLEPSRPAYTFLDRTFPGT
jgi:Bacterial PH domain